MSTETKPYVTDEQINAIAGDSLAAQAVSSYEFGKCVGRHRGANAVRDLYEAHLTELRRERDEAIPRSKVVELVREARMIARAMVLSEISTISPQAALQTIDDDFFIIAAKCGLTL